MDVASSTAATTTPPTLTATATPAATSNASATAGATPSAAPEAAPSRADSVQFSDAALRASRAGSSHRHHHHHAMPSVDDLATGDEAKLSDLASTFRQGFADRLKALGITVPTATPAATNTTAAPATTATYTSTPTAATTTDATTPTETTTPATPAATTPATATPTSTAPVTTTTVTTTTATPPPATVTTAAPTPTPTAPAGQTNDANAPSAPQTAGAVQGQLDATLGKLQHNADQQIEKASANVPAGNDRHSRYLQFLARRKIGYVTDLTRAEMKHAKEAADYQLAHLPGGAGTPPAGEDPTTGNPPPTPTPTTTPTATPTPTPTTTPTPTPTATTPTATPPASPSRQAIARQISQLRQSAEFQLHRLAEESAGRAARIEWTLNGQLDHLEGELGVHAPAGGPPPEGPPPHGGDPFGGRFGPGSGYDVGPGFDSNFGGRFGFDLPPGFGPAGGRVSDTPPAHESHGPVRSASTDANA